MSSFTNVLVFFLSLPVFALDVLVYIFSLQWLSSGNNKNQKQRPGPHGRMQSVAAGEATESHGAPRRAAERPDDLYQGEEKTIYEMTQKAVSQYGRDKIAMASRKFVEMRKIKPTDKFPSKIFDNNDIEEINFTQLGDMITNFGAGLRAIGMEPIPQTKKTEKFDNVKGKFVMVIFEDTCKQWTIAMQGAFTQSMTVATCYATLGTDAVVSAVNQTGATTLLCNWKNVDKFTKIAAEKMPSLENIIASTHEMPDDATVPSSSGNVQVISSDEIMKLGQEKRQEFQPVPPQPSDVAVIMYTSGSTGTPKGVLMKHSQLVAGVSGMAKNLEIRRGKEVFISYLPLAHILAMQVENGMIYYGVKICYSGPRELTDTMPLFKPTIFAGVPKVWDTMKTNIEKKMAAKPTVKAVFDTLLSRKRFLMKYGMDTPVSNLFFKAICKKIFGNVLRYGVSGGGPMSTNLQEFCRACFCCPIVQGYALTETCVGGCFQALDDTRPGIVGPPVSCVEVMLQSEPDIMDGAGFPYLHTDRKGSKSEEVIGRGEICIRGPSVSSGYYKLPDKTKEEYDDDGWFHTGDIGQFTADGVIQIVDRKKNLVKLRGGEYVAVEAMENAFNQSSFANAVCVVANGDLDTPLAIVHTDSGYLKKWAKDNGIEYKSMEDLADKPESRKAVVDSMVAAGKKAGLTSLELRLKDCCLIVGEEWGPGQGMTATMKIDRKKIFSMHKDELNKMLKRNGVDA